MFDEFAAYAVYWVPARPDPLSSFGTAWTGWCAERGECRPLGDFSTWGIDPAEVARGLHCHGLHGVIHAPFRLAPGRSRFRVEHLVNALAEGPIDFRLPPLALGVVEDRVALVPAQSSGPLAALITRAADSLAPLAAAAPPGLAEAAADTFDPAAFDPAARLVAFRGAGQRFHVPLTDRMAVAHAHAVKEALAPLLAPMLKTPRRLGALALMADPGEGRPLRVLQRYELPAQRPRRGAEALPAHGPEMLAPMPHDRPDPASAVG